MNTDIKIIISKDFTDAPGARDRSDGDNSGQEFFEDILKPKFIEAQEKNVKLIVDFDDSWGYASSFLSGAFGRLADDFGKNSVLARLVIISDDDSTLHDKIPAEINKSENNA